MSDEFNIGVCEDMDIVLSILSQDDVWPGFCGRKPTKEDVNRQDIIYFLASGVGLFVANIVGDRELVFHAAIPKVNRGKKALSAARSLAKRMSEDGYKLYIQQRKEKHLNMFAKMAGFTFKGCSENKNFYAYEVSNNV